MDKIFFDSWESLLRSLIVTIMGYVLMVFTLRVFGKRSLSKMNAFDFVITVSLGSTLASLALNKQVALADGALVILLLIGMQFLVTWCSVRFDWVKDIITNKPTMLGHNGQLFRDVMKKERINEDEIWVAARKKGIYKQEDIATVILETTGELTIISGREPQPAETLQDVARPK